MTGVGDGRVARTAGWLLAVLAVGPLVLLPVWAVADAWRAPALLPQAFGTRGFEAATASGTRALAATGNSLVVALATTALAFALAWPAARWLATAPARARTGVLVVLVAPLLVPPLAVGTGLVEWFLRLGLAGSRTGVVLAHLVAVLPYVVVVLAPGFGPRVRRAEEAAATLGATPAQVLRTVTVPMVAPVAAVAALLGALVSWSQYGTSLGVGGGIPLLPLVLEPFVGRDPQVAAVLSLALLAPAVVALLASQALSRPPSRRARTRRGRRARPPRPSASGTSTPRPR